MKKVIIIADDLTGANATGVLLAKERLKTVTIMQLEGKEPLKDYDVVAITTNSRSIDKKAAYDRVSDVARNIKGDDVAFFNKRIDSTLRGNIGSEIDAILDNLDRHVAVVVASFPSSSRVCIGDFLMVNSIPLELTAVAKDPKNPITTSKVTEIIAKQTKRKIGYISLQAVLKGADIVCQDILTKYNEGAEIIVIDATTDDDIKAIALACKMSQLKIVTTDPGPFTYYYAKECLENTTSKSGQIGKKVLAIVGSVSELTRRQVKELQLHNDAYIIKVNPEALLDKGKREFEISEVVRKVIKNLGKHEVFAVVTTVVEEDVIDLNAKALELGVTLDQASNLINTALAEIGDRIIQRSESVLGGVYTSGGDVTVAFCERVQAGGVEVKDDIVPLAVYGKLMSGQYSNMPIVTKGGLIGDDTTLVKCIDYLLTKTSTM